MSDYICKMCGNYIDTPMHNLGCIVGREENAQQTKPTYEQLESEIARLRKAVDSPELLEKLADIEHERWSGWMKYEKEVDSPESRERWERQMNTPYAELSEHEKESDRAEARKSLAAMRVALGGKE